MKRTSLCGRIGAAAGALAAFALGQSVGAPAQSAVPVDITACEVINYMPKNGHAFWDPFWPYPGYSHYTDGLRIAFINRSPQTAVRVAFRVNYRGAEENIIDAGTFSSGVNIDHTFGEFTGFAWLGPKPNECRVVAVRFSDGSVWHASGSRRYPQNR